MGKKKRKKLKKRVKKVSKAVVKSNPVVEAGRKLAKGDIKGAIVESTGLPAIGRVAGAAGLGFGGLKGPGKIGQEGLPSGSGSTTGTGQGDRAKTELLRRLRRSASRQSFALGQTGSGKRLLGGS